MAACLSRSVGLPPVFPNSSLKNIQMEDSISSDNGKNRVTSSVLRRTLSAAEMCSKKCTAMKKTASVEHLQSLVHDEEGGNGSGSRSGAFEEIWGSIRSDKKENDEVAKGGYVHPLVKRSASSLSEKSLEICTESLGSETGSDVFSFLEAEKEVVKNDVVAAAEEGGRMKEVEPMVENSKEEEEQVARVGYSAAGATRSKRSLPPPLPSLAHRSDGSNLQMRCHRQDGRLVVEAVEVPSRNCFKAERQDGRLLLTFSGKEEQIEEEEEEEIEEEAEEEEIEEEEDVEDLSMEKENEKVYKFLCLTRRINTWAPPTPWGQRLNKVVPTDDVAKSPDYYSEGAVGGGATASLNSYVYLWRSKEAPRGDANGQLQQEPPKRSTAPMQWDRRQYCIATS